MPKRTEHRRLAERNAPLIYEREQQKIQRRTWDLDPQKQYVRRYGWLEVIRNYLHRRRIDGVREPWKYLTMPGPNASDIGFLLGEKLLEPLGNGRLNVAICDAENGLQVGNNLGEWGGVLAVSQRYLHEELISKDSEFNKQFPFDVVNMDLCDSLYHPSKDTNLIALEWILLRQRGSSFLLLLTTNPEHLADRELINILNQNLRDNPQFKSAYEARYAITPDDFLKRKRIDFAQITLPKWLARAACEKGYRIEEHFAARYKGRQRSHEIIAHSFELEPIGAEGIDKYLPRFDIVEGSLIKSQRQIRLPRSARDAAEEGYEAFVAELPSRSCENVTKILNLDKKLNKKLEDEAAALDGWYVKGS